MTFSLRTLFIAILLLAAPATTVLAQDTVGAVTRLAGGAQATGADGARVLAEGAPVRLFDLLETGPGGRLLITFQDGSELTLGENARISVDSLVYDPQDRVNPVVSQTLTVLIGNFRLATGEIGRADPKAVTLFTPVATIGIRGTDLIWGELAAGMPPGQTHWGAMVIDGAIAVATPQGAVVLDRPNEGTFLPLAGGAAPTPPRIWSRAAIEEALASVRFE